MDPVNPENLVNPVQLMTLLLILSLLFSQTPASSVDQKSQEIIDHAIETLGGQK